MRIQVVKQTRARVEKLQMYFNPVIHRHRFSSLCLYFLFRKARRCHETEMDTLQGFSTSPGVYDGAKAHQIIGDVGEHAHTLKTTCWIY